MSVSSCFSSTAVYHHKRVGSTYRQLLEMNGLGSLKRFFLKRKYGIVSLLVLFQSISTYLFFFPAVYLLVFMIRKEPPLHLYSVAVSKGFVVEINKLFWI
jgi:hypothetical protein